ncbi:MAG: hypothetical protein O7F75_06155 [Alphaproteobacteria bacterium]|nr:hypothetical protein [Alphaproteobacteria bacterium]
MSELHYVHEKLISAISSLATHPGRIAERMRSAYIEMQPINRDDLPNDLRGDLVYIHSRLGAGSGDTVPDRINSLSETDLSEIAASILSLADRVDTALRESGA